MASRSPFEPPFEQAEQLINKPCSTRARRKSDTTSSDSAELQYLHEELDCPVLDELEEHAQFFTEKSGDHISPLHVHLLSKHQIVIVEDPGLHLLWYYSEIYLKPIPHVLLNHKFWQDHLCLSSDPNPKQQDAFHSERDYLRRGALGFLRSYAYLIHHPSDFEIAKKHNLIPSTVDNYDDFQRFIENFRRIEDKHVSRRWQCGQMRLSRLNWAVRIFRPEKLRGKGFLRRVFYLPPLHWQSYQVLEYIAAPAIAVFAFFSVALSAMQVVLATSKGQSWSAFIVISWGFSVAVLFIIAVLIVAPFAILATWLLSQLLFSFKQRTPRVSGQGGMLAPAP